MAVIYEAADDRVLRTDYLIDRTYPAFIIHMAQNAPISEGRISEHRGENPTRCTLRTHCAS